MAGRALARRWAGLAACVSMIGALPIGPARGQPVVAPEKPVGADVLEQLCATSGDAMALACDGFLRGTMEGLLFAQINAFGESDFCPPAEGLSTEELRQIFLEYLEEDPDRHDQPAAQILLEALDARYPCDDGEDVPDDPAALLIGHA
ncbi:Rap1a/Tai family immunity protein [Sphingobium sp. AP49]|uniref:Rap1a/Tai family immunity protein n=1 Tax=Sphingobium sp. AP49 TaxID=1144307 RepID=UPI00026EC8E6|nr:Rap1a/Tai family immunity protein [Sphingobium sp. AP49]WHO40665.1 Rap1a/Tai family immunity protein [Sphingobium sp. AP49]